MNKELIDKIITYNYNEFGNEFGDCIVDMKKEIERLKEENTILKQTMSNNSLLINENAFLKERISKAIEYIENEMPCLWEVDDVWEDIDGNYQHNYKEYDTQILLNKLKGVDKE